MERIECCLFTTIVINQKNRAEKIVLFLFMKINI